MKKNYFIKVVMMLVAFFTFTSMDAQTAIHTSKFTDNIYVGAKVGATSPLSFDAMFPTNVTFGIMLGKEVTPVLGFEIEGTTWFGSNANKGTAAAYNRFDAKGHNVFRAINLGLNAKFNLLNIFNGYKGKPQVFELGATAGLGWLHTLIPNSNNENDMSAKTGLTASFNLGKNRIHTLFVAPVIYWNLSGIRTEYKNYHINKIKFDRDYAQFGLEVGYIYHFKNSNGTHYFKTYDVGAMLYEIDRLNEELAKKPTEIVNEVEKVVDNTKVVTVPAETVVFFAYNKYELDENAKQILDRIPRFCVVDIVGTASVEGTEEYNNKLSEKRAKSVEDYLVSRGLTINSSKGIGTSLGETSNRVAIVTIAEENK